VAASSLATLAALTRTAGHLAAVPAAGAQLLRRVRAERPAGFLAWAAEEMRRHDVRMLTEAAHSMTRFDSRSWLGDIDVPTAVLRTNRDRVVDPARQTAFVTGISCARLVEHDDGHIGVRTRNLCCADAQRLPRRRVAGQRLSRAPTPPTIDQPASCPLSHRQRQPTLFTTRRTPLPRM
jgi:hypothetical protein